MINEKVSIKDFKDLEERVGKIGEIIQGTEIATNTQNNTYTSIMSIVLPPGVWHLTGNIAFTANNNGCRGYVISTKENPTDNVNGTAKELINATNGFTTRIAISSVIDVATETTFYLNTWQNCGSTLSVAGALSAFRLS